MEGFGAFLVLGLLVFVGFLLFTVYVFVKSLEFVITATNLYKKIVNRQDAIIKVLIDIRDGTKQYSEGTMAGVSSSIAAEGPDPATLGPGVKCPGCDFVFRGEYGNEGWWCPNCNRARR